MPVEELERMTDRVIWVVPLVGGIPVLEKCQSRTVLCTKLYKPSGYGRQTGLWLFCDDGMYSLAEYGKNWIAYCGNPMKKE